MRLADLADADQRGAGPDELARIRELITGTSRDADFALYVAPHLYLRCYHGVLGCAALDAAHTEHVFADDNRGPKPITHFAGRYRFLSNFVPVPIVLDGERYASVEHAFQAAKSVDKGRRRAFQLPSVNASSAKAMGRRLPLRPSWEDIKLDVMLALLRQKFSREPFKAKLLETGHAKLIEGNTWGDRFWGVYCGVGQNMLGHLLMRVRAELRAAAGQP